jgi:hypothetical protein
MRKNAAKLVFILVILGVYKVFNLDMNSLLVGLLIGGVFTYIMLFLAMEERGEKENEH